MAENQTIGELYKAKTVTDDSLNAAVAAILAGERPDAYPIADGPVLDVDAAVKAHDAAEEALADPEATPGFKRTMARRAILLARPVRG